MWMIWETGNKSLREIGELFGGLDYTDVAQRIRRTRSSHDPDCCQKVESHNVKCLDLTPFPFGDYPLNVFDKDGPFFLPKASGPFDETASG